MCAWVGWALIGLPIAYLLEKKYHRGWMLSILGGISLAIIGATIIGFVYEVLKAQI